MYIRIKKITANSLAALLLLTISMMGPHQAVHAENTSFVTINDSSGEASVLLTGAQAWQRAKKGLTLSSGSSIKTGDDSYVNLVFNRERTNIVSIRPNSHVVVQLKEAHKLTLVDGTLFSSIQGLAEKSSFEIQTPLAVCGVRGTKYTVKHDAKKTLTTVAVLQNSVVLESLKEQDKFAPIKELQERKLCPWQKTVLQAVGIGFSPEATGSALTSDVKKASRQITEEEYIKKYAASTLISARRAATTDAYRNLTAKIYGTVIDSTTILGDYAAKDTAVKVTVNGIVRGATETGTRYYTNGSIQVNMEIQGMKIKESLSPITGNIFGTTCLSSADKLALTDFSDFEESLL